MENLYLNLKERYPFDCPRCGKKHAAAPSIIMKEFQMNHGRGHCTNPDSEGFYLKINEANTEMITCEELPENEFPDMLPAACYATMEVILKNKEDEKITEAQKQPTQERLFKPHTIINQ